MPDVPFRHEQFPDPFGLFACLGSPPSIVCPALVQASPSATLVHDRPTASPQSARSLLATAQIPVRPCSPPPLQSLPRRLPSTIPTTAKQTHVCPNSIFPPLRQSRSVPRLKPLSPNLSNVHQSAAVANNIPPRTRTPPIVAFPTTSSYSSG